MKKQSSREYRKVLPARRSVQQYGRFTYELYIFERLWCPFTWSALFFNVVIIPPTHKRQRRSVELLHPVKEENFNLPQPGTHSCLHLIARRVKLSFQVFLHLRETEDIRSYIGILRQMQYSFSDRHTVSAISFPVSACVGSISHTLSCAQAFHW